MPSRVELIRQHTLTHGNSIYWVAFSADGQQLASASLDNTIGLWSAADGSRFGTLKGHGDGVTFVAFLPGERLLSAGLDKSVKIWKLADQTVENSYAGHQAYLSCAAVNSLGTRAVSGGFDRAVRVNDIGSTASLAVLDGHTANVQSVAISSDGRRVVSGSDDTTIRVWDVESQKLLQTLNGHTRAVEGLVYGPGDAWIASAGADGGLKVWSLEGELLTSVEVTRTRFKSVAASADGRWLATGDVGGHVRIWDRETLQELTAVAAHRNTVFGVAFNPEGTRLASAGFDRTLFVWDVVVG